MNENYGELHKMLGEFSSLAYCLALVTYIVLGREMGVVGKRMIDVYLHFAGMYSLLRNHIKPNQPCIKKQNKSCYLDKRKKRKHNR